MIVTICMPVCVQLYLSLCVPSFHGMWLLISWSFLGRTVEWVAMFFSKGSSGPRDWTCVSCIGRQILYYWATREALISSYFFHYILVISILEFHISEIIHYAFLVSEFLLNMFLICPYYTCPSLHDCTTGCLCIFLLIDT